MLHKEAFYPIYLNNFKNIYLPLTRHLRGDRPLREGEDLKMKIF